MRFKLVKGLRNFTGLMFRTKNTTPLIFEFESLTEQPIHSYFCPKFKAIWLDEEGELIEIKIVTPFKKNIKPKRKFKYLLEIPLK